ncbi:hypothetical protein [Kibdelosporangium phytohabitans]|uniref:ESX-1 secretion-associated protein n=1 Tax=Kibdelosporangium phytohabitans TaxID=860235 RepID=A0A0N9I2U6_9PSEU|nr:hypothetical protein [Kibdelosporangium phytohabitans]ALG10361.1 hypothetical protein AOZ06_28800 [Kibdelosporangium phytohabitans]MBE1461409.1 hypothetical protein [Kibdelosporangium phytohabitans]
MPKTAQVSVEKCNQQAARHEAMADNISQKLDGLKTEVHNTMMASTSAATRALTSTCDNWVEAVRKTVLDHMRNMAENIRREASNQEALDQQHMEEITKLPLGTLNFLGVPS